MTAVCCYKVLGCLCKWLTLNMPSLAFFEYNGSTTTWSDVNKFDDTMTFFRRKESGVMWPC